MDLQTASSFSYPNVHACVSSTIGNTPLVQLHRLAKEFGLYSAPLAKLEYFNPAGSIKDRPAKAMMDALVRHPNFHSGIHIIEASSGNNGVACAWLGALYGIAVTIVIPEHMSVERQRLIRHYGGKVITTAKSLGTKGAIDEAARLVENDANAVSLNQFSNTANPMAHGQSTAQELLRDTGSNLDVIIAGVGTGGTITGLARTIKKQLPHVEVIAVEPASCPILSQGKAGVHNIQGLSSGHIPDILDLSIIDRITTVTDDDAVKYAQIAARLEGIAVGISSGATLKAACDIASQPSYINKSIVTIMADGAERYFSTPLFE